MTAAHSLRLLAWNVRSLRDGRARVAAVIRNADVDVVLLQEAPRLLRWRSKRAALAREAGLVVVTADRVGGLCVLTSMRVSLRGCDHRRLPSPGRHQRALVTATVSVAGGPPWQLAVAHLGLQPHERAAQAAAVAAMLPNGAGEVPSVLAADVNDEPGSPPWRLLAQGRVDCLEAVGTPATTFPSRAPRRRIDAVFAAGPVAVRAATVLDTPAARSASDHLPLLVTLQRAGQSGRW